MATARQVEEVGVRNGIPMYVRNPSIPANGEVKTKQKRVTIARGQDALIINGGTGELLGKASAAFMHVEEVEPDKFVKIFLAGVKQLVGLSKAGMSVFEMVYAQTQAKVGSDQIILSAYEGKQAGLSSRTYYRGLRDLLEKEILYATPTESVYFLNIQYIFNGNRLHFVQSYHLKESSEVVHNTQPQLEFDNPPY